MDTLPVAAAVIVHEGRILLLRRRVPEGNLIWQFPAGQIKAGETPHQAAVRETREEAGLDVTAGRQLGERTHPLTGRHITYLACTVTAGTAHVADLREVSKIAWITLKQLPAAVPYGVYPPVQAYLDQALTHAN